MIFSLLSSMIIFLNILSIARILVPRTILNEINRTRSAHIYLRLTKSLPVHTFHYHHALFYHSFIHDTESNICSLRRSCIPSFYMFSHYYYIPIRLFVSSLTFSPILSKSTFLFRMSPPFSICLFYCDCGSRESCAKAKAKKATCSSSFILICNYIK